MAVYDVTIVTTPENRLGSKGYDFENFSMAMTHLMLLDGLSWRYTRQWFHYQQRDTVDDALVLNQGRLTISPCIGRECAAKCGQDRVKKKSE
ncbi:hypothetical protein NEUTE1DRAFT_96198 [Neurospora tetrasperma FGSC 2508]|uniref:Uncharacterized protein n=1 Tax=Neurospora tetrasperma (strain FGSC 2508 / ATCC MYA-4615 / P0657) TaxID=510951 RepID=F8MV59_NEUT8|nr:uncharacterized protein NEUTE1DRAFT_96198 [Neurospora tetrasperma FGSC 2508]EGO54684.1 hypothetical protein NEUTE1DRAFT_96198 [Neurospora tetrasperma FGSC 2508]